MSIALVGIVTRSSPGSSSAAARLVLATRRREQVRRQLSPVPRRGGAGALGHAVERRRGATRARAEALLAPARGSHESVQLHIDRAGIDVRAGALRVPRRAGRLRGVRAPAHDRRASASRSLRRSSARVVAPWVVLHVKAPLRRSRAFERQLPEILDTLAASLRAGHGFDHGLQTVATDVGEPAGREFRRVVAEVHLGRSLEDALAELGRRIRSADLQFVLDAIAIQRQVGGSLAELFELVAHDGSLAGAVPAQPAGDHRPGSHLGERAHRPADRRRGAADARSIPAT